MNNEKVQEFIGAQVESREFERRGRKETFYFREMGSNESELFLESILPKRGKDGKPIPGAAAPKHANAKIIAKIVCDKDGNSLFTEEEAGEIPTRLTIQLRDAALEINGLTDKAAEDAKNE